MVKTCISKSEAETEAIAKALAKKVCSGEVVLLVGTLGAGKTVFVRGLVSGLNGQRLDVVSPTFTIIKPYSCDSKAIKTVYHVDLYRLDPGSIANDIDLSSCFAHEKAVTVIEWAEKLPKGTALPKGYKVEIKHLPDDTREIRIYSGI